LSIDERFENEVMPHARALFGTAYRLTRSPQDAEDLVQETLLRAYRGFAGFRPGSNARAWLYTILHRVRTDLLRKRGRSPSTVELEDDAPAAAVLPRHEAILTAGNEDVQRALGEVPELFRQALLLRDVEEFSYDEIAGILGVPPGTVMSRIHRGRAHLRRAFGGRRP
jgi:RNA polymerase sigma-70 factor (ECF subfamily)